MNTVLSYIKVQPLITNFFTVLNIVKSASVDQTTPATLETGIILWTRNTMASNSTTSFDTFYPGGSPTASIYVIIMLSVLVFLALLVLPVYLCHKGEAYRRS